MGTQVKARAERTITPPVEAVVSPTHPCDVCPTRSTAQDSSYGYCEGCTSRLRRCPSCEQHKQQTDWGYGTVGLVFALIRWVCADCRIRVADGVADHPRFRVALGLQSGSRIGAQLTRALEQAADTDQHHPAVEVLRRIAGQMTPAGGVDVDVSGFGLADRRAVLTVLARLHGDVPHAVGPAVYALARAWGRFVDDSAEPPPTPASTPSVAERVAYLERDV